MTCRHRDSWLLGGVWEWCYRCGALRRLRVTGPAACAPDSRWQRPVGAKGSNPFKLADLPKRVAAPICTFCDGCGWCEGSPAFTCPRCNGSGAEVNAGGGVI